MTENERLKSIRNQLGLTQRVFSESLDIKQGSYSDVERGKAGVSAVLLKNLIRKYRVNPLWLCEGEGSMFIEYELEGLANIDYKTIAESAKDDSNFPSKHDNSEDSLISQLERQQQYLDNVKGMLDFLNE